MHSALPTAMDACARPSRSYGCPAGRPIPASSSRSSLVRQERDLRTRLARANGLQARRRNVEESAGQICPEEKRDLPRGDVPTAFAETRTEQLSSLLGQT